MNVDRLIAKAIGAAIRQGRLAATNGIPDVCHFTLRHREACPVRREAGATEAAAKQLAATEALLKVVQREDPHFAADLVRTGAPQDPRFIQTAAKIVDSLRPQEQTI